MLPGLKCSKTQDHCTKHKRYICTNYNICASDIMCLAETRLLKTED